VERYEKMDKKNLSDTLWIGVGLILFAPTIFLFYLKNRLHSLNGVERECVCGSRLEQTKKVANQTKIRRQTGYCNLCRSQVDRKMFYRWWSRYQAQGWKGLEEKPRGRPSGPELNDSLKQKIIKLRKRYEWGPNKIVGCLNRKGFNVDHNQVYPIICEAGLKPSDN
jgi:transposase